MPMEFNDVVEANMDDEACMPVDEQTVELVKAEPKELDQLEGLTFEQRLEIAKLATSFDSLWDATKDGPITLAVSKMLTQECQQVDQQTGEVTVKMRTYFYDDDRERAFASTSDAVYAAALPIMRALGPWSDWERPVSMTFSRALSRGGNEYLALDID